MFYRVSAHVKAARPRIAGPGTAAGPASALIALQRRAGNAAVVRLLDRSTVGDRARQVHNLPALQRCGGEVHSGCPCAGKEGTDTAVSRDVGEGPATAPTVETDGAGGRPAVDPGTLLRQGAEGPAVVAVQQQLNSHGAQLVEDGKFGPMTRSAVVAFQRRHGLAPDGAVGPRTQSALDSTPGPGGSGVEARPPVGRCRYAVGEREASRRTDGQVSDLASEGVAVLFDFEPGSAQIRPRHAEFLRALVSRLQLNTQEPKAKIVVIQGFTDCVDVETKNSQIRRMRALTPALFLLDAGAHAVNLGTQEAGPAEGGRGDNSGPPGRAMNRSALIVLKPVASTKVPEPPRGHTTCPGSHHFKARITASIAAGDEVGGGLLGLEMHDLDCNRGQRFVFTGAGVTLGTPIGIGGTSNFENFVTVPALLFPAFEGVGRWSSAQAQLGLGPSIDFVTMAAPKPAVQLCFSGLLNFPSNDAEETGKGIGVLFFVGSWARDGSEFVTGSGSIPHTTP